MEIYFTEISEDETAETTNLLKFVSEEKQNKLRKYRFQINRKLSLYSELLVHQQIMNFFKLNNDEIEFRTNEYGKPFFPGYPSFHFNISHTRNAIAIVFSNEEVGIDIEKIKPPDFQIADRIFTFFEQNYILSHENPDRAFFEVWTKKEAYIKCLGIGLAKPLKSFDIFDVDNAASMYRHEIGEYIVSAYCKELMPPKASLVILTENEIHSSFKRVLVSDP